MIKTGAVRNSVTIIIVTRNYARFLGDAIESARNQSVAPDQIIVVDDGSVDNPMSVTSNYPDVTLLSLPHRGISAARNAGLAAALSRFVIYLDGDDVLCPNAIEAGLRSMAANPGAGFVYGAYTVVDRDLNNRSGPHLIRARARAYRHLLEQNMVSMHAAVLFDREKLEEVGGFDETVERCEDYDLFLRMARRFRVASHPDVVAQYRMHGDNMSQSVSLMYDWHRRVLERNRPDKDDLRSTEIWARAMRGSMKLFVNSAWKDRGANAERKWSERAKMSRIAPRSTLGAAARQLLIRLLPFRAAQFLRRVRHWSTHPQLGEIDFGDLGRIEPISNDFGFIRGTPVDRHYIEAFLAAHASDITGHTLEAGDATYVRQFGTGVTGADVINVRPGDPNTTITGDIGTEGVLDSAAFDCIVLTQVFQYVWNLDVAAAQIHRALRPGGVLLATVPSISPIENTEWTWYWNFNVAALRRMLDGVFGAGNVEVEPQGNAFAATCFLQGVSVEDVGAEWLEPVNPSYPVCITVRAVKPA
ncbi:MAG: glycosyltransferase [Sphingomonadales bacterium]|nr:glycosyltransferase [Sphingomonadales bacterium]